MYGMGHKRWCDIWPYQTAHTLTAAFTNSKISSNDQSRPYLRIITWFRNPLSYDSKKIQSHKLVERAWRCVPTENKHIDYVCVIKYSIWRSGRNCFQTINKHIHERVWSLPLWYPAVLYTFVCQKQFNALFIFAKQVSHHLKWFNKQIKFSSEKKRKTKKICKTLRKQLRRLCKMSFNVSIFGLSNDLMIWFGAPNNCFEKNKNTRNVMCFIVLT